MTYEPKSPPRRVDLEEDDRKLLQSLAREMVGRVTKIRSVQTHFGSSALMNLGVIIVQDPDNPDTVQICVEVVSEGPPYEIACWCDPPGVCIEGPCPGSVV